MILLRESDCRDSALPYRTLYVHFAAAHLFESSSGILHTDMGASVLLLRRVDVKSDAVIRHDHLIGLFRFTGRDSDRTALFLHADAVLDGVFHQRLDAQLRQDEIRRLNIIGDIQLLSETELFDIQILL